ncbi:MAG: 3-hydroxybutyryl-CoA dehydrogenase [Planctomycetes bacterium]|nr:3-hydroxybutyryl-CoA dehydrogenase [Planctomycetota bacterium]
MSSKETNPIGIVGAGTMGTGIAQVVASAGWPVILFDIEQTLVDQAFVNIQNRLASLVDKGRITLEQANEWQERISTTTALDDLENCDLIIESVVEAFDTKVKVLQSIGDVAPSAIIATNTSSLPVSKLGAESKHADRIIGMHFFNPAPAMQLVEIVRGKDTSKEAIQRATLLAEAWDKTVVLVSDTPGFIVNRISKPFYLESWRIIEDGIASVDMIDETLQSLGEFRIGPFLLTDMIGQDISVASTRSIWERLGRPNRLAPIKKQESLIARGNLGRKTGCGAYAHDDRDNRVPAVIIETQELELSNQLEEAINTFCLEATCISGSMLEKYIFSRVLVGIINEAMWAITEGVASAKDVDTAMKLGMNFPLGPIEWSQRIGLNNVHALLTSLNKTVVDNRFLAPPFDTVSAN